MSFSAPMPTARPLVARDEHACRGSAICSTVIWNWNSRGVSGIRSR